MADFRGYVTAAGQTFEALAKQMGYPVTIGFIEVGDGKLPDSESPIDRTQLVHKLKQFPAIVEQDTKNPGQWVATCYIPADDAIDGAGYFIREIGCKLINQGAGVLYAYRRVSDDWKPVITSGEAKSFIYKLRFIPSNGELLTPTIDPSVVLVDKEELARVMKLHVESRNHPDASETEKGFSRLATQEEVNDRQAHSKSDSPVVTAEKLWGWAEGVGGSIPSVFSLWKRSMAEAGYDLVDGAFEHGGILDGRNSVMLHMSTNTTWSFNGELPHRVEKGTVPSASLGYTKRSTETLRKTSFDIFGATDSPFSPSYQELKIVAGGGERYPGKMFVLTKGGGGHGVMIRLFNGNISHPSLPSNSENDSWALWRTGLVHAIEYAWVYKKPSNIIGTWVKSDVTYSAIDINSDAMLGAYMPLERWSSPSNGIGDRLDFNVSVGLCGNVRVGFLGTETAPTSQKIMIDGKVATSVNLRTGKPSLIYFDIKAEPGLRVISIVHEEVSTTLHVIGVNFMSIDDLSHWNIDVDSWASYIRSPSYVTSEGASDYAFRAKNGENNWAGSYHGGEYERAAPEFSLDHKLISPNDNFVGVGRRFSILQRTQLRWKSTLESLDIDSMTIISDASVFMQCAVSNANLIAHTAFAGMNTASPSYDSAIGSKYYDDATSDGVSYQFGPCQQITQIERSSGRMVYTRFSRPPLLDNSYGGSTVSYAKGAYAKVYSGFIRNASVKLPNEFCFSFQKAFN